MILSLQEDNSNNLWVGTNKGISKINLKTDEITNFECDENGNPFYKVRSILLTERGTLIVITQKNVYLYDEKKINLQWHYMSKKYLKQKIL